MTWPERLESAKTEIARRKVIANAATPAGWVTEFGVHGDPTVTAAGRGRFDVVANVGPGPADYGRARAEHIAANDPAHVLHVLEIHRLILALVDPWLIDRLDRPSPMTDLVRAILDLYAPEHVGASS